MSAFDPKHQRADATPEHEAADTERLFPPELRAELRRELGPAPADRARVRHALLSSVAAGTLTPAAQRVDALLHGHAASAAAGKTAVTTTVHALTTKAVTKLIVVGVVIAGGASAVVMRGPSAHERPAVQAPASAHKPSPAGKIPVQPVEPRSAREPEQTAAGADEQQATAFAGGTPTRGIPTPGTYTEPTSRTAAVSSMNSDARPTQLPAAAAASRSSATDRQPTAASSTVAAAAKRDTAPGQRQLTPRAGTPLAANSGTEHANATEINIASSTADGAQPKASESTSAGDATQPSAAASLHSRAAPTAPQPELAAELALVRAASAALQRGDAPQALAQLERHSTRFPQGALRVEAQALRAIALCSTGAANAAATSGRFIELHAGSPLAERVQRACSQGSER